MQRLRVLCMALMISVVIGLVPPAAGVGRAQRLPLGGAAQFLPPDAAFYLSVDLSPDSEQVRFLDRLYALYVQAPEAQGARRELGRNLGLNVALDEFLEELRPVGGDVFVGLATPEDWHSLLRHDWRSIDLECRELGFLVGAAIGDRGLLREILTGQQARLEASGVRTVVEQTDYGDVIRVAGRSPELAIYVAFSRGYLLMSDSRARMLDALAREPGDSLAAAPGFREARARFPGAPLAFLYSNFPGEELAFAGGGIGQSAPTRWMAGAMRLSADLVNVEVAASTDLERISPAGRALLAKEPNPVQAAGMVPTDTAFFASWHNPKLLWNLAVESNWPEAEQYAEFRAETVEKHGFDPEDDLFGWMTGELAVYTAPSHEAIAALGDEAIGLAIEAKDPDLVRAKIEKLANVLQRLSNSGTPLEAEQIEGVPFHRLKLSGETSIYLGLVGSWVSITTSRDVAAKSVAAAQGGDSLRGQPEYQRVRSLYTAPIQFFGYVDVPRVVYVTTSSAGAGDPDRVDPYARPARAAGLAVGTSLDRLDSMFAVHVVVPEGGQLFPPESSGRESPGRSLSMLTDLTRHGGAWVWGDETERASPLARRSPLEKLLAERLDASLQPRLTPGDHVGRQPRYDPAGGGPPRRRPNIVEPGASLLLRVGSEGSYSDEELTTYVDYVRCGGTLMLLSDGKAPGEVDQLAEAFGLRAAGVVGGGALIDTYAPHPTTRDLPALDATGRNGLIGWDEHTLLLGFLSEDSYLDLDGNGRYDQGEPSRAPALAVRPFGHGTVAFLGTTSVVGDSDYPLMERLVGYWFPDAPRPAPDAFEPDDTIDLAKSIELSNTLRARSLHSSSDIDWIAIRPPSGRTVRLQASGPCDVEVTVYAEDGATLVGRGGSGREVIFTTDQPGPYYVEVRHAPPPGPCNRYFLNSMVFAAGAPRPGSAPVQAPRPAPVQIPRS